VTPRRAAAAAAICLVLAACREKGRPDPAVRMAISHEPVAGESDNPSGGGGSPTAPTRLEVPPAVTQAFSGIRLAWKDAKDGKEGVIEVPIGATAPLPDPSLVVRADVFLPAFTMAGGVVTSEGVEPQNEAARVTVLESGKEIFGGWIFKRFPDVHPFSHPRFKLLLEGGVPRSSK